MAHTDTEPALARNVRAEMARFRFTQKDLSGVLEISQSAAGARLRGAAPFKAEEIQIIANWLKVPIQKLYGE